MDALQLVRSRLGDAPERDIKAVAEAVGVPFHTLLKIAKGRTKNPRFGTLEPVRRYLERRQEAA